MGSASGGLVLKAMPLWGCQKTPSRQKFGKALGFRRSVFIFMMQPKIGGAVLAHRIKCPRASQEVLTRKFFMNTLTYFMIKNLANTAIPTATAGALSSSAIRSLWSISKKRTGRSKNCSNATSTLAAGLNGWPQQQAIPTTYMLLASCGMKSKNLKSGPAKNTTQIQHPYKLKYMRMFGILGF